MSHYILIIGVLIFIICLGLHILVWRWYHPRKEVIILFLIFLIIPAVIGIAGLGLNWFGLLPGGTGVIPISAFDWPLVFLLHFSLAGAYILSYPAIQAVSPSLAILLVVESSALQGLTSNELRSHFTVEDLLEARLRDLKDGYLAVESDGWFRLTWRGLLLVRFNRFLRILLGLPTIGG